jgi:hypothetical protein
MNPFLIDPDDRQVGPVSKILVSYPGKPSLYCFLEIKKNVISLTQ